MSTPAPRRGREREEEGGDPDRREADDDLDQAHGDVVDAREHLAQALGARRARGGKPDAEDEREEHHGEHVAAGHRLDDVVGDDVDEEHDPGRRALPGARRRRRGGRRETGAERGIESGARLEDIDEGDSDRDRDGGDGDRVEERLESDAGQRAQVAEPDHAEREPAPDERDHEHEQEAEEDPAGGLGHVLDERGEGGRVAEGQVGERACRRARDETGEDPGRRMVAHRGLEGAMPAGSGQPGSASGLVLSSPRHRPGCRRRRR